MSAFVLAAVILLGSLTIWAASTQNTNTADVGEVYDIDVEPNDDVTDILSNTTISADDEFGGINENKTLFTISLDDDYPEDYINGTISLYNSHEISRHLHDLNLQLEANGEEVGWLGLSMGYARFEVSREFDDTEIQINTTGEGSHTMKEEGEFELGFLLNMNEKQNSIRSQEEITAVAEEYTLSVDMNVDGTLLVDEDEVGLPYDAEYEEDTVVELEAIPDEDVEFIEWSGDVEEIEDPESNQTTITINDDYSITAVFETDVELTVDSTDGGVVLMPGEGSFTYNAGEIIDLEAEADEGHYFVEWTGDVDTIEDVNAQETTIEMLDDYSITANFAPETYDLTFNIDGEGTVEVDGDEIEDGDTLEYEFGTVVDLEAIPEEEWSFVEWIGDVEDPQSPDTSITVENDDTITAVFEDEVSTVMIGREEEIEYEGDDEWVTYWSGTANVDGLDEMNFRYEYELTGDSDGPGNAVAGVEIVVDGESLEQRTTSEDEERTVWEDDLDVSDQEEVEIEFLVYTETGTPRDSVVTIYEALVESVDDGNANELNEGFENTISTNSSTTYDKSAPKTISLLVHGEDK